MTRKKHVTITLTRPQYAMLIAAMKWVDPHGDYPGFGNTKTKRDRETFRRMVEAVESSGG